jgi:hypothetical protein
MFPRPAQRGEGGAKRRVRGESVVEARPSSAFGTFSPMLGEKES